jgi:hypothetical protein
MNKKKGVTFSNKHDKNRREVKQLAKKHFDEDG